MVLLYQTDDVAPRVEVRMEGETTPDNIGLHG